MFSESSHNLRWGIISNLMLGPKIAVTGASGFLGYSLLCQLSSRYAVVALVRNEPMIRLVGVEYRICGNLSPRQDWANQLTDVDVVIHTAARAHVLKETDINPLRTYRTVNVESTLNLANQAWSQGVKRLIFVSSIGVHGASTGASKALQADDAFKPHNAYSTSKMEAELGLHEITKNTGMELVCIRPPLVYGPRVKGNFHSMLKWLSSGIPLPLGAINNTRSLVGIDNLVDLIITTIEHPAAANQTFLVSDDEDLSTTDLLCRLGKALQKPVRLLPVSKSALKVAARLVGRKAVANQLLGNLRVDVSRTRDVLDWSPPVSVDDGLKKTARWYLSQR